MVQINEKFSDNLLVYQAIWKIVKGNTFIDTEFVNEVKKVYQAKKVSLFSQFATMKLNIKMDKLNTVLQKLSLKYVKDDLQKTSIVEEIVYSKQNLSIEVIYTLL